MHLRILGVRSSIDPLNSLLKMLLPWLFTRRANSNYKTGFPKVQIRDQTQHLWDSPMIKGYNLILNSRGHRYHKRQIKRILCGALIVRRRGTQKKHAWIFTVDQINLGKAWSLMKNRIKRYVKPQLNLQTCINLLTI